MFHPASCCQQVVGNVFGRRTQWVYYGVMLLPNNREETVITVAVRLIAETFRDCFQAQLIEVVLGPGLLDFAFECTQYGRPSHAVLLQQGAVRPLYTKYEYSGE
jgi:hypothetical protein